MTKRFLLLIEFENGSLDYSEIITTPIGLYYTFEQAKEAGETLCNDAWHNFRIYQLDNNNTFQDVW